MGHSLRSEFKPDGAVCPLLIRERPHFCSAVIDVEGQKPPHAPQQIRRELCGAFDPFINLVSERYKVDRLGQQRL